MRLYHNLEIVLRPEIADLQFAQADDPECWRRHPPDADDAACPRRQECLRCGARQGQVEDLIGLLARDRRLVKGAHLPVRLQGGERLAQRFGVLRGEERALHAAAIAQMFQDFLADKLALAVAVGSDDHRLAGFQRRRDGLQLGGLVAARVRPGEVEAVRL
jgi:hypothetical protein